MKDTQIFQITQEDVDKIIYAFDGCQCGELYRFLGVKKEYTIDKIALTYKEIRSNFENDKMTLERLDVAYSIISDKRLRDCYDKNFYNELVRIELEYNQSISKRNNALLSMVGTALAPLEMVSVIIHTAPNSSSSVSSMKILQSFFKNNGFLSVGKIFLAQAVLPSTIGILVQQQLYRLKDKFAYPFSKTGKITDEIINYFSSFIVIFPIECYVQTVKYLSFFEVIKKVVLCQDGVTGKFNFKNLAHTFISSFGIYVLSKTLRIGVDKLEGYIESKSVENPNSAIWRNALLIKSVYVKSILMSLVLAPLEAINSQYSYLYVQRYLGNPVQILTNNPISLAVDLVKTQGFKKLYKSLPFSYLIHLLEGFVYSFLKGDLEYSE
ncbi:hypothetical protein DDB_G0286977 [Dictyostelium discoideum AX4]|uniref:J domain-containing protein n=1 Tax=Dictyostelium discoideum TaxID=44689 RepID=Q54L14_DICDI|nr:hypothetical protein DDB_G0286977 [Dictyostelium discoideum AX4]EAL63986.1 hypothetical protein DDB_G0286977 [Dictyostelium discoideum AX4]|eukprot:XP_637489.1 hypothetical protein DDB_G0286977 [Dictyostelium discoideum AX4]